MKQKRRRVSWIICCCLWPGFVTLALASDLQEEYVTTTPVLVDAVLYVASSTYPGRRGHLRAIDIHDTFAVTLWDAGSRIPLAGSGEAPGDLTSSDPPEIMQRDNLYRSLFTNFSGEQIALTGENAARLQAALGVASQAEAEILIHAIRGRRNGTLEQTAGSTEEPRRLWNLSRSSPVLVGSRPLRTSEGQRDRVLYVGAEDGMLHAFFVSRWDADVGKYLIDDPDGGVELWAYLPGSFLPHVKDQPFAEGLGELAVHLDGSPVVRELFLDLDNDGRRSWSTLLVASGTISPTKRSCLFVMDVTNPYRPRLLWEKPLPGVAVGRTRGIALDRCGTTSSMDNCIYLTADLEESDETAGIHALALTLETGQLLWQFTSLYSYVGPVAKATPAVPALMDLNGDDRRDTLVFGDLSGQLWALALADGHAYGDAPVFQLPGGNAEPIGAGVAVHDRMAIFGTGGVEGTDDNHQYALYAVEIFPDGGLLRWRYLLAQGEKVWQTPTLDLSGNLLFATALDYLSLNPSPERPTSGRVIALNGDGEEELSRDAGAATLGRVVKAPGVAVSVALTGEVTQLGVARRLTGPVELPGTVKVLSWRQR